MDVSINVPQNGWFIKENSLKLMIWGYHHVRKHHVSIDFESFLLQLFGLVVEKSSGTTSEKRGLGNLCKKGDFLGKASFAKKVISLEKHPWQKK